MPSTFLAALTCLIPLLPYVAAHGQLAAVQANGVTNEAPNIYFDGDAKNADTVMTKMYQAGGKAFNTPNDYYDAAAMACENSAAPPNAITVDANGILTIYYDGATGEIHHQGGAPDAFGGSFPFTHAMGTVAVDIADCSGSCTSVNPADLLWHRIVYNSMDTSRSLGELRNAMTNKGEPYYPQGNGVWGLADFVSAGSKIDVQIPNLVSGGYMVRIELAAMHSPGAPQLYNGCVATDVQGSGTQALVGGTLASALYDHGGSLATFDVYSNNAEAWTDDGPALLDGSSMGAASPPDNEDDTEDSDAGSDETDAGSDEGDSGYGGGDAGSEGGDEGNGGYGGGDVPSEGGDEGYGGGDAASNGGDEGNGGYGEGEPGSDMAGGDYSDAPGGYEGGNGDSEPQGGDYSENADDSSPSGGADPAPYVGEPESQGGEYGNKSKPSTPSCRRRHARRSLHKRRAFPHGFSH